MDITQDDFFKLVKLYNSLGVGIFKKVFKKEKKEICESFNITSTNFLTYNKIINILQSNEIIQKENFFNGTTPRTRWIIDSVKLDRLIRSTEYFEITDKFIHESTGGFAETGV
jgi:hypothetical protein